MQIYSHLCLAIQQKEESLPSQSVKPFEAEVFQLPWPRLVFFEPVVLFKNVYVAKFIYGIKI